MTGKDLRIGNWILVDGKEIEVENVYEWGINGRSWSDTHYGVQSGGFDMDYEFDKNKCEGIPLSEDAILKLKIHPHIVEKYPTGLWFYRINEETDIEVKYIHNIQNLHWALTGEDLIYGE